MGCGTSSLSSTTENLERPNFPIPYHQLATETAMKGLKLNENNIDAFQRLDEQICHLESLCPAPRLATIETWIDYLKAQLALANEMYTDDDDDDNPDHDDHNNVNDHGETVFPQNNENSIKNVNIANSTSEKENLGIIKVRKLAVLLGVPFDIDKARKQEEFLARISQTFILELNSQFLEEIIEHAKKRAAYLLNIYNDLKSCYTEQDGLLTALTVGKYFSNLERKLDETLDKSREMRDKLGNVAEQWRTAGNLIRTSAKGAIQALEFWNLAEHSRNPMERITLATDCRHAIQGSLIAVEYAQKSLPHVEFQFITQRQISAVRHANIYLLTDMAHSARFQHTKNVFESYQTNVGMAVKWLHDTFQKTLKRDIEESENNVQTIAKQLRQERVVHILLQNGNKMYIPAGAIKI